MMNSPLNGERPLRAAIVGMGGFARNHHHALRQLEARGEFDLLATCDLRPEAFENEIAEWEFETRGVKVYRDYLEMLDRHREDLDIVCVPTPIPLHAPMHRACVERGLACYVEKPPTLWWAELDAMLEVERRAQKATQVGFNFIVEEPRRVLKRRLAAGEFGRLRRAGVFGHWPRGTGYYKRAPWAGKLRLNGQFVLDSPSGNALAHYVHNLLFWCGQDGELEWGNIEGVEAELYRAHAIESFDTVFARGRVSDVEIRLSVTHACSGSHWQREWLECDEATIHYGARGGGFEIQWRDGRREQGQTPGWDTQTFLVENLSDYGRYLRGQSPRPLTTLEDSRPFVTLNDLLFVAAGHIVMVPPAQREHISTPNGGEEIAIRNIEETVERFAQTGQLPSELGLPWAVPGGSATPADLPQLEEVIDRMQIDWKLQQTG